MRQTSPTILAFVGMPGSGKGTCSTHLERHYAVPVIHFGNMVYEEVQRRGLHNVEDEREVREDMRRQGGPAVLAQHVAVKIDQLAAADQPLVALDGLYSWSEYRYMRDKYADQLVVIALAADRAERYRRVVERKDGHRHYNLEQVQARDIQEIEHLEKGGPIAIADYTLVNNLDQADLIGQLEALLRRINLLPLAKN